MDFDVIFRRLFDKLFFNKKKGLTLGKKSSWYIFPKYLSSRPLIYSGGVGNDISFELDLEKKFHASIFLFDPSPTGIETMRKIKNKKIHFSPCGLNSTSGKIGFQKPENSKEGSWSAVREKPTNFFNCVSLGDFTRSKRHKKIDLLKLDIEGFEYGVIREILSRKINITQICVEFHPFFNKENKLKTKETISFLKKKGYFLVHRDVYNYTFIKKKQS